jgi:molybdopterin synthase catalytic subunit
MSIANMLDEIKKHPDFEKVGMILCHNGVVRATTRDGRRVKGLTVAVDHAKLEQIVTVAKARYCGYPGKHR